MGRDGEYTGKIFEIVVGLGDLCSRIYAEKTVAEG